MTAIKLRFWEDSLDSITGFLAFSEKVEILPSDDDTKGERGAFRCGLLYSPYGAEVY